MQPNSAADEGAIWCQRGQHDPNGIHYDAGDKDFFAGRAAMLQMLRTQELSF